MVYFFQPAVEARDYVKLHLKEMKHAEKYGAMNCIECGLCSYNCPATRALVQSISMAKTKIKEIKSNGK